VTPSPPNARVLERGSPAPRVGGAWVVEEARALVVELDGGPWQLDVEGRPLAWDQDVGPLGGVTLSLPFAVGRVRLSARRGQEVHALTLDVQPAAHKLGATSWSTLLADLERWLPGLGAGVEANRLGGLALSGLDLASAVEALLPLLPSFERAIALALADPRTRERATHEDRPIHLARRADPSTLAWISRHPREAAWLRPDAEPHRVGEPPTLPLPEHVDTLDHPVNRYLVWLIGRVARRLDGAAEVLGRARCSELNDTKAWVLARTRALRAAAARLRRTLQAGPLAGLRAEAPTGDALLVLGNAPAYARAHRIGRRLLASGFRADAEAPEVATRPSYELYELWCFLAIQRELERALGAGWRYKLKRSSRLLSLAGTGSGARFVGHGPEGASLTLDFNPVFSSLLQATTREDGRHAITRERRPDLTIAVRSPRGRTWLALDAKYRVGAQALGDAFSSAHLYRDALRWPRFGGRPAQALLLTPRADAETERWFSADFLNAHAVGAVELTPGAALHEQLAPVWQALSPILCFPGTSP